MLFQKLNAEKERLVADNLDIVKWVIRESITVNERIVGFEYNDLFQEGCIWLCKAADTYDSTRAKFKTYAQVVIRRGLLSYCRKMYRKDDIPLSLDGDAAGENAISETLAADDEFDALLSAMDIARLLASAKSEYSGVARLGIEALELKGKGYPGTEIAAMYGVKPNLVGAWISRAAARLRCDEEFLAGLG